MPATDVPRIPTPGSPAYWQAQREAVTLFRAWEEGRDDPDEALRVIRRVAAHGFARRLLTAHGYDVERLLASCEAEVAAIEAEIEACREASRPDPDEPPSGDDWCPRGCQPLFRMDCGVCGYAGRGVWADAVSTVAEYCCHCDARTYQSRDGICERCGRNAEGDDEPPPPAAPPAAAAGRRRPRTGTPPSIGCRDGGRRHDFSRDARKARYARRSTGSVRSPDRRRALGVRPGPATSGPGRDDSGPLLALSRPASPPGLRRLLPAVLGHRRRRVRRARPAAGTPAAVSHPAFPATRPRPACKPAPIPSILDEEQP